MPDPSRTTTEHENVALLIASGLTRRDGSLYMGGVSLAQVAERVGTPAYVYSADHIRRQFQRLDAAFADVPHRICYAVKANSTLAVLRLLRDLGAGADLVSAGELRRALSAGFSPEELILSGVGKTAAELRLALEVGVGQINAESVEELSRIAALADATRVVARVGLRINPDVTLATHPYIATGNRGAKFGIPSDDVGAALEMLRQHESLRLVSVAMHLGSQVVEVESYVRGVHILLATLDAVRRAGLRTVESLDIGGGFGIQYDQEPGLDLDALSRALVPLVAPTGLPIVLEPGRFLVGNAGVLLAEVQYRKVAGGKTFLVLDAGMSDLLRPALYQSYHDIVEVEAQGRPLEVVDIVGPACESGDFLALARQLPAVAPGEALAVLGAGAYGFVMSSNYNSRPRPVEVLVDGSRFGIIRERETVSDLLRGEAIDPFGD